MQTGRLLSVLLCSILLVALGAGPTTAPSDSSTTEPTSAPAVITWDQAKDHIGEKVLVTGPVIGTHKMGAAAVLNVGKDFPDPTRLTVFLGNAKGKDLPADLYVGKTITVKGRLKIFHKLPEVEADAAHITVESASTTASSTQPSIFDDR